VAAQMGISSGRLSKIEGQPALTERLAERYLLALGRCIEKVAA
jgi:hypothetical protein